VFDHYYHGAATARAARDCGLAAVIAPTLQDLAGPGAESWEEELSSTRELDADSWRQRGIVAAVGPHATDTVSAKLWRTAVELAAERDLVLHAHVAQSAEEARRSLDEHGCSPIAWLHREGLLPEGSRQLLVHALFVSQEDLGRLDPASHVLGANPYSQMQFGFPAPVREWMEAGLDWFVGTDCGASNDSMDVQKELRLISGQSTWSVTWSEARRDLRTGLDVGRVDSVEQERRRAAATATILRDPRQLLHRVWGAPGTWHPALKTGVIEPGARAQLCVYDPGHPALWPGKDLLRGLSVGGIAPALTGVIASGEWVGEPGNPAACLRDPVVREWIQEASRRHELLLERAGIGS
jgi:cytosine/adenosine deaminase-related metal-dependent hydrolase